jgi:hypothetical protein
MSNVSAHQMLPHRMPEAEVSLRLAIHLVMSGRVKSDVVVALDGAQVKVGATRHFDVLHFLHALGWRPEQPSPRWQCRYFSASASHGIVVHSQSGRGDVTATLSSGEPLVVEAKKGTLANCKSSSEYPLLREALGQLLTLESVPANAVLAVAVPHGERFVRLAERWRNAPLVKRSGIRLLTVAQTGEVMGW